MARRIPGRFERVAAAFDADVARVKQCKSSGSEHSEESWTDLSDLVKSFMEKNERLEEGEEGNNNDVPNGKNEKDEEEELEKYEWTDSEKQEILQKLFEGSEDDRNAKEKIRGEVELAYAIVGDKSSPEFKRRLMAKLRENGFDAGLCKSKWEKNARFPSGDYEYIDVNFAGKRYIVEVSLAGEFEIARPSNQYSSLLDVFPLIFVGKVEELKRIVRLMCTAIKGSMKSMDLLVPPWRRSGFVQAKWFSAYRRTTKRFSSKKGSASSSEGFATARSIGFEARPVNSYCRDHYVNKTGSKLAI